LAKLKVMNAKTPKRIQNILKEQLLRSSEAKHVKEKPDVLAKDLMNLDAVLDHVRPQAKTVVQDTMDSYSAVQDTTRKNKQLELLRKKVYPVDSIP
jgi:hypothetical protein